jgi:hypothetical protein
MADTRDALRSPTHDSVVLFVIVDSKLPKPSTAATVAV